MQLRRVVFAAALIAGCGVAAPSRIDLSALVKRFGPADARHELEVRIVSDPRDIAARLALAKLCEQQGRPSQALEQLEAVLRYGGPIGTRWHDEDRARFARLLAARGLARSARGAPTSFADLSRAREYGAKVSDVDLRDAKLDVALAKLRHVDAKERAAGLVLLRELAGSTTLTMAAARPASTLGSMPDLALDGAIDLGAEVVRDPAELGIWLWSVAARRASYELLAAWHDKTRAPRDERLQNAYLRARAWWVPIDGAPPLASELVGPERCRHGVCNPWDLVQNAVSSPAIDALLATSTKTSDPEAAYAWLAITLAQSLRGEGSWAELFAARVDLTAVSIDKLPPGGRAAFALVTGREATDAGTDRSTPGRYLAAAVATARGAKPDDVRALLGPLAETPDGAALLAIATPPANDIVDAPYRAAVTRFVQARVGAGTGDHQHVKAMLDAYARDPIKADRIARDVVAGFADAAAGHAWVGALYDAIQDPARARTSWQAAVQSSPEPPFVRGLAVAIARANDPDAALVIATQAAAASGDPSPVWIAIAEALHANGSHVHALEAARYAIDLATAETAARAFDIAIAASEALGRMQQATGLRARRAKIAPLPAPPRAAEPDAWRASRWNPRDVTLRVELLASLPATDARRQTVIAELVKLAADRDVERARAAIRALR